MKTIKSPVVLGDETRAEGRLLNTELLYKLFDLNLFVWRHSPIRTCMLCLAEKYTILQVCPTISLNRRTELIGECRTLISLNKKFYRKRQGLLFSHPGSYKSSVIQ